MPRKKKLPEGLCCRGNVYYARFREGGRQIRKRLSPDLDIAKRMLADLRSKAYREGLGELDNDYPLAKLFDEWIASASQTLRPSTIERYRQNIANLRRLLPVQRVGQLSLDLIEAYRVDRLAEDGSEGLRVSPRTVNMEATAIRTAIRWGLARRKLASNPLLGLKKLPEDEKRKERRSLTPEEVDSLFRHSPEYLRPVWRMFACTGMRRGEVARLRFADIDFDRCCLIVRSSTAKSKRSREIPLDEQMLANLRQLKAEAPGRQAIPGKTREGKLSREHVFVTTANTPLGHNLLREFYRVCKRAGIAGAHRGGSVDIHSLRVTVATQALDYGANIKSVSSLLGHSTIAVTADVYAKATSKGQREAVSALPWAKAAAPSHIVSFEEAKRVQNEHSMSTSEREQVANA